MNSQTWRAAGIALALAVALLFSGQLAGQAKGNLVKEVNDHKADVTWITYKTPTLPDEVCSLLAACSGPAAKVAALPPATIGGRKVGRALFLTQVKNQQAIILEHQVPGSEIYFFLLGPDGSLQKTAYVTQGQPYLVVANSLAQPKFDADMKDWEVWAKKLGSEKPSADKLAPTNRRKTSLCPW
jgi:hypothetical protein